MKRTYIAIKLKGFSYWLWFKTANVVREQGRFQGKDGWGCEAALSECDVDEDLIEGEIHSDSPQYD